MLDYCPIDLENMDAKSPDVTNSSLAQTAVILVTRVSSQKKIQRMTFVAYGIVAYLIVSLGILGNAANLLVLRQPCLKGVTFVYLFWLAVADMLALGVSITTLVRLQGQQARSYSAAFYFAHVEVPLVNSFMAASVFIVVALTVNRFFSVCLPTRFKDIHNLRKGKRCIVLAYVSAFVLYVPVCFEMTLQPVQNATQFIPCENRGLTDNAAYKTYIIVKEILVRAGPVVLLVALNAAIIVTFRRLRARREMSMGARRFLDARKAQEGRRLLVLLGGIAVMFVVCMTPAAALTILYSDQREYNYGFQTFRAVANCLELSNFSLNFCVYYLCSPEIRRAFSEHFRQFNSKCLRCTTIGQVAYWIK